MGMRSHRCAGWERAHTRGPGTATDPRPTTGAPSTARLVRAALFDTWLVTLIGAPLCGAAVAACWTPIAAPYGIAAGVAAGAVSGPVFATGVACYVVRAHRARFDALRMRFDLGCIGIVLAVACSEPVLVAMLRQPAVPVEQPLLSAVVAIQAATGTGLVAAIGWWSGHVLADRLVLRGAGTPPGVEELAPPIMEVPR